MTRREDLPNLPVPWTWDEIEVDEDILWAAVSTLEGLRVSWLTEKERFKVEIWADEQWMEDHRNTIRGPIEVYSAVACAHQDLQFQALDDEIRELTHEIWEIALDLDAWDGADEEHNGGNGHKMLDNIRSRLLLPTCFADWVISQYHRDDVVGATGRFLKSLNERSWHLDDTRELLERCWEQRGLLHHRGILDQILAKLPDTFDEFRTRYHRKMQGLREEYERDLEPSSAESREPSPADAPPEPERACACGEPQVPNEHECPRCGKLYPDATIDLPKEIEGLGGPGPVLLTDLLKWGHEQGLRLGLQRAKSDGISCATAVEASSFPVRDQELLQPREPEPLARIASALEHIASVLTGWSEDEIRRSRADAS